MSVWQLFSGAGVPVSAVAVGIANGDVLRNNVYDDLLSPGPGDDGFSTALRDALLVTINVAGDSFNYVGPSPGVIFGNRPQGG